MARREWLLQRLNRRMSSNLHVSVISVGRSSPRIRVRAACSQGRCEMLKSLSLLFLAATGLTPIAAQAATLNDVTNIVVIYAENRSFDNLYGSFPGANGIARAAAPTQVDRDGVPLKELP